MNMRKNMSERVVLYTFTMYAGKKNHVNKSWLGAQADGHDIVKRCVISMPSVWCEIVDESAKVE